MWQPDKDIRRAEVTADFRGWLISNNREFLHIEFHITGCICVVFTLLGGWGQMSYKEELKIPPAIKSTTIISWLQGIRFIPWFRFVLLFIQSFNTYWLSTYYVPGTALGSASAVGTKGDVVAVPILPPTSQMEEPSTQDGNGTQTQRGFLKSLTKFLDHCTRKLTLCIHSCIYWTIIYWRRRKWQTTPVSLPGKSHAPRSLVGCSPWGHKELGTTEWLTESFTENLLCDEH